MKKLCVAVALLVCLASASHAAVDVQWFYVEGCFRCREVKEAVARMEYSHSNQVAVTRFEITDLENYKQLMAKEKKYGISKSEAMEVFVGDTYLLGHSEILGRLDQTVAAAVAEAQKKPPRPKTPAIAKAPVPAATGETEGLFKHMGPLVVAGAGLIDGINPCAFATIIFLVSILASRQFTRKQIVTAGLAFSGAVFLTYFLIGLGAFKMLYKLESFERGGGTVLLAHRGRGGGPGRVQSQGCVCVPQDRERGRRCSEDAGLHEEYSPRDQMRWGQPLR